MLSYFTRAGMQLYTVDFHFAVNKRVTRTCGQGMYVTAYFYVFGE